MKINFIGNTCNNAYAIVKSLRRLGVDAHLFYNKNLDIQTMPYSEDPELLENFPDWLHPYSDEDTGPHPFRNIKKEFMDKISDCDLIQAEDVGIIWAMQSRKPYIWVPYGWDLNFYSFYSYWQQHLQDVYPEYIFAPVAYRRAIANSSAVVWGLYDQNLRHGFQIIHDLVEKERFVHNNTLLIDTNRFTPKEGLSVKELLKEAGKEIPVEGITIFFPSRIMFSKDTYYSKRSDVLLYAAGKLKEAGIPFTLIIVEKNSPDETLAKEIIKSLGIEDRTVWIPKMERHQLVKWYSASDITADEFSSGAVGSLALEAMACNGAVMTYFKPEHDDPVAWPTDIAFGTNPPLVNVYSVEDTFKALQYYSLHKDELKTIGRSARQWVENTISGKATAEGFIKLYKRILEEKDSRYFDLYRSLPSGDEAVESEKYIGEVEQLIAENKIAAAYQTVLRYLEKNPDNSRLMLSLIKLVLKQGKVLLAVEALKHAIELMPNEKLFSLSLLEIYRNIYKYFISAGDLQNSIHFCAAAVKMQNLELFRTENPEDHLTLADLYLQSGRYQELLKLMESVERNFPGSTLALQLDEKFRNEFSKYPNDRIRTRKFEDIASLSRYLGFSREGQILEENIDVMDHECDMFQRKRHDAEVLTTIAANVKGKCFDIGTSFGSSAYKLATNVQESGVVYTVNILPEQFTGDTGKLITHMITREQIGSFYRDRGLKNVVQLYANTLTWQIPDELNDLDMVFVDGGHDAFTVYSDTKNIYSRVKEGGYILWHDFNPMLRNVHPWINEVMSGIERFLKEFNITSEILYLKDSWIGILRKESPVKKEGLPSTQAPQQKPAAAPKKMRELKYLMVYPAFSENTIKNNERYLEGIIRSTGLNISCSHIPCNGSWLAFPQLDKYWKEQNPVLMKAYEELMIKASQADVLINAGGSMLHPDFVKQLPTYNVFMCGDDPESSEILSKPIAPSYDLCLVTNIASLDDYKTWGCKNVKWIFHPVHDEFLDPGLKGENILFGNRSNDIIFLSERSKLSDRDQRIIRIMKYFPQAIVRGNGWPGGYLENLKEQYLQTKIGWNFHHSTGPTNRRTFELPALGLMQLCDNKTNLGRIYKLDKEAAGFDSIEECIDKTRYYLAHDNERREIAYNGWKKTIEEFTIGKWWDKIMEYVEPGYRIKTDDRIGLNAQTPLSVQTSASNQKKADVTLAQQCNSARRKKILLIADVPGWIFERHCRTITKYLSGEFDFDICYMNQAFNEDDYDLIYPLEYHVMNLQIIKNPAKYITGIRSHWAWERLDFSQFCQAMNHKFQRVHTVSKKLQDIFKPHIRNLAYVTHGVDTSFFSPSGGSPSKRSRLRVGWAGNRDTAVKGFQEFIAPLGNLAGVELVFFGYKDTNLNKEEMLSFYNSIDVYVCSSASEGNNNSLLEAASMERAIVTTDNGTVNEYLVNGESAIVVKRELQEFISAIERLRDNPALRLALGKAARKSVVEKFDWKIKMEDYRDLFRTSLVFGAPDKQKELIAEFSREGKTDKAIALCVEIIRDNPEDISSMHLMAALLRDSGQAGAADEFLRRAGIPVKEVSESGVVDLNKGKTRYYPATVHFLMNDKCNAKCIMCGGDYARSRSKKTISFEKFRKMCENLGLEKFSSIVLAGAGDPLLNKELLQIIAFVNEKYPGVKINITTNGIALTGRITDELIKLKVESINVSINSATAATYKRIMQVDCFDKVCKNVKYFNDQKRKHRINTLLQFSSAINRLNIEELPELVRLSHALGAESINVMYCRFYPDQIRNLNIENPADVLKDQESLFFCQELSDQKILETVELARKYGVRFTHEPLFRDKAGANTCRWPESQLMVGFDGEVYPCGGAEIHFKKKVEGGIYKFGNVLEQQLTDFWNDKYYCALRISSRQNGEYLIPECRNCANLMSPNKYESHIMTWEESEGTNENSGPDSWIFQESKKEYKVSEKQTYSIQPGNPSAANTAGPLISVIVPTFNRPEFLGESIRSILAQSYSNFEVIVVNDAGKDVKYVIDEISDSRVRYVCHEKNKGLAAARNTGISNARGKYIAYLDDDDIYYPNHLSTLVNFLESGPYSIAYTDAYRAIQELRNGKYVIIDRDVPFSRNFSRDMLLYLNIAPVQCFMHEKSICDELGLFDETLPAHEDWEYWLRLSRKYDFMHLTVLTSEFRQRTDSTNMTTTRHLGFYSSYRKIIHKYYFDSMGKHEILNTQLTVLNNFRQYAQNSGSLKKAGNNIKVSIVIPVFNKVELTKKCLESLYENTPEELNFEVIIVDNASTDGTRQYLIFAQQCFNSLTYITNSENTGFAKGNNLGISRSRGKYIVCLNNDTEPQPGWLEALLNIAENDESVAAVGSKLLFPNGTIQHAGVVVAQKLNTEIVDEKFMPTHIHYGLRGDLPEAGFAKTYQVLTAASMLVRKDAFLQAGGFDEQYWNGYEDVDLCFKLSSKGWKLVYQPESIVIHHESQSGPERFTRNKDNVRLLHSKWIGKIEPDYFINDDNKGRSTGNGKIGLYIPPSGSQQGRHSGNAGTKGPFVSIIVLTFNGLRYNKEFINSVLKFTKCPYEIIVVDNDSKDGTVEYLRKLEEKHPNIRVIYNEKNLGFPAAVNQALKAASGNFVLVANNDIVVTENWLERMVEIALSDPGIGIVGSISNSVSGVQLDKNARYKNMTEMHKYAKKVRRENAGKYIEFPRVAFLCTLIKKEVIDALGGLDERFSPGNFEDDDYCLRTEKAGCKTVIAKDVFIHHYGSKSFKADGERKYAERLEINKKKFVDKWGATIEEIWLEAKPTRERSLLYPINQDEFMEKYERALVHYSDQEFELAEEALKSALEIYEADGRSDRIKEYSIILNLYANLHLMNGDLEKAKDYFERQLKLEPGSVSACLGLGEVFFAAELYKESKEMFQWAAKNEPDNKNAAAGLAKVNRKLGLSEGGNGLSMENQNRIDGAAGSSKSKIVNMDIKMNELLHKAEELIEQNKLDQAVELLFEVVRTDPKCVDALNNLAVVSILSGDFESAADFIEKVVKIDPANDVAMENMNYLSRLIDEKMNRTENNTEISLPANNTETVRPSGRYGDMLSKAESFIEKNELASARKLLETILMMEEGNLDALNDLSVIEIMEKNYPAAVELLEKVIRLEPDNEVANENILFLQKELNNL